MGETQLPSGVCEAVANKEADFSMLSLKKCRLELERRFSSSLAWAEEWISMLIRPEALLGDGFASPDSYHFPDDLTRIISLSTRTYS